ncbi:protein-glutamate methylesterase/protein-glutamine glutaminase [Granulosicoccus sp. 3-233]|uniref:protein-glutamate methylesterase/protein-glutamine glutaminase n=1 Tax=Granulosicoccus sp. 3-233 TaxID=3417969 RepID=UPI003D32AF97
MANKRILVVDDSSMYQRLLSDVINSHPQMEVVGVAVNGREALEKMDSLRPHLVTLDILMPQMDGIQTLMELRRNWPDVRTVMVSSLTSEGSDAALDALTLGAHEYAAKPVSAGGISAIRETLNQDLLPKIAALCDLDCAGDMVAEEPVVAEQPDRAPGRFVSTQNAGPELVVIGVSTGGPDALTRLLLQLPGNFGVPICIVQHMPAEFTGKLAARLNAASKLTVCEACAGDRLQAGTVYVAPGDYHMVLERVGGTDVIRLNQNPMENSCRPSVDPLFRSAAAIHGARCLGIVMTGMGRDGLKGSEVMYAAGGSILVQDEASSVVWGMPKLVAQAGLAEAQVPLERMARAILDRVMVAEGSTVHQVGDTGDKAANASNHRLPGSGGRGS